MNFESKRLYNPAFVHENRLPARAPLIPAQKKGVYFKNKEESELITFLNGDFLFSYREKDDLTDFYKMDFDDSGWDILKAPSMWQYHGYSEPLYPNVEYPIPLNPPYVGNHNPVGYYRKRFNAKSGERKILYFGGVDSAFFVYLNGEYVGFSKGSRMPAEFDVSELICDGENLLCVKVFTYCDGTYLENQDMLLASGIFRDVMLYNLKEVSVWDYSVRTEEDEVFVDVLLYGNEFSGVIAEAEVNGEKKSLDACEKISFVFKIENPVLWNAEEPYTYELNIVLHKNGEVAEIHSKKFGFAKYEISGNKILLNGTQLTVKGINRHEYDPKNGRAITVERIERELKQIKEFNMNAIRCAHYPNHPAFYEIATELGIYVMNEADIETHGANNLGDMGYFSKSPEWYPAYFDRVERMYECDKNETCIFIRTVGNENGNGENIEKCIEYLRSRPVKKPIMHTGEVAAEVGDFRADGYFTYKALTSHKAEGAPVMLLEYGHAMGNSPGLMEDTWDYVYKNRHICGGFVWEFKNHGFYAEDEEGREFYKYGGDFHDKNHWSNFSMDGYCLSDGTPKPSFYDCKNVLAPTYTSCDGEKVTVMNTNDFKPLDYVTLKWELAEDFKILKSGEFKLPKILPYESMVLDIDTKPDKPVPGAKYMVNMHFFDDEGREIAYKQAVLGECEKEKFKAEEFEAEVLCDENDVTVCGKDFKITISDGMLSYYEKDSKILIAEKMHLNLYRAPIDNDGIVNWEERFIRHWNKNFYQYFEFMPQKTEVNENKSCITVSVAGKWAPFSKFVGFDMEITYKIFNEGIILTEIHGTPYGRFWGDVLPRIGVYFTMEKSFSDVLWYGRGEDENYSDRKAHCNFGLYSLPVEKMNFLYDVPQECGTRIDTSFVSVKNEDCGFAAIGCDKLTFSYHDFSLSDLTDARHRNELKKSDKNYFYIDYCMRGLGSHSCGPNPEECYELHPHEFKFVFVITALCDADKLLELSRKDFGAKSEKLSDSYVFEETQGRISVFECNINREDSVV